MFEPEYVDQSLKTLTDAMLSIVTDEKRPAPERVDAGRLAADLLKSTPLKVSRSYPHAPA